VLSCFWISIPFSQTKVNHVDDVLFFAVANKEVVGLHISVDEMIIVQEFKSLDHLVRQHQSRFDCEFALAIVEEVFQTWPKQIHNHSVIVTFNSEPVDCRDASTAVEDLVDFSFIKQLWKLGLNGFL